MTKPHPQFLRIPSSRISSSARRHSPRGVVLVWHAFALIWGLPTPNDIPTVNPAARWRFSPGRALFTAQTSLDPQRGTNSVRFDWEPWQQGPRTEPTRNTAMVGYPTARRWNVIILTAAALLGATTPARAATVTAVCTMRMTVDYNGAGLGVNAATTSITFASADGSCQGPDPSNLPFPVTKTIDLHSTGTPIVEKRCALTTATGNYSVIFGIPVAPFQNSSGTYTFAGNAGGATIKLEGTAPPTFVGVVELVPHPDFVYANAQQVLACQNSNMREIVYLGTLTFVEVTSS